MARPPRIPSPRTLSARGVDLAAVGAGGALGTLLRTAGVVAIPPAPGEIPWVTAGTNLLGAFLLGVLVIRLVRDQPSSDRIRLFLLTGVLGSFTTFSALAVDLVQLAEVDASSIAAAAYLGVSVPGGILAGLAGMRLGDRAPGTGSGGRG